MGKICCGFGHRNVFKDIKSELEKTIEDAIDKGCDTFYTGAMGEFDSMFSSAVRAAKHSHPEVKLICVKPYLTKELQESKEYYYSMYDDIIIPTELADTHYKSIITKRNKWMIDQSDIIITHTIRDYGGAYTAMKYAKKTEKDIIEL